MLLSRKFHQMQIGWLNKTSTRNESLLIRQSKINPRKTTHDLKKQLGTKEIGSS